MFSESQNSIQITPRLAFVAGLISGVLVLCTIGFILLGAYVVRGKLLTTGSGAVKGADLSNTTGTTPTPTGAQGTAVDPSNITTANAPFIGNSDAPVTMFYWRDFQCPYCQQFEQQTLPSLIEKYVKTGKMKIYFKDFAFLGPDSQTAALASRAAWESAPTRYFDWQTAVFNAQGAENSGWASADNLAAITKKVSGVTASTVTSLMTSKQSQYQQVIASDKNEATAVGINGTPGFVIGTSLIAGAEPLANFEQQIESQLK